MSYELQRLFPNTAPPITNDELRERIDDLLTAQAPRFARLWDYYANPIRSAARAETTSRPYRQAQEWGLPSRLTGEAASGVARKEIVIENDIAWRIDTLVDYLFGKTIVINSAAPDPQRRGTIELLLRQILAHNGGITFLQHLALLGAVYGFVDVLVKLVDDTELSAEAQSNPDSQSNPDGAGPSDEARHQLAQDAPADQAPHLSPGLAAECDDSSSGAHPINADEIVRLARRVRLEIVEPLRALPLLSPKDFRQVLGYAQAYQLARTPGDSRETAIGGRTGSWLRRLLPRISDRAFNADSKLVVELITPTHWQRYEDEKLVAEGVNSLGQIPLAHVQNSAVPFSYSGGSDVEPLLPLQDELNTRLSDRAHRITMQSFKMYLGKGIDGFDALPVAPGRMWATDNDNAEVIEFGGDSPSPAEENHIRELREALDKTSGVTPIAAGAIEGRIGRLTSAAALRVTLQALLAKTERKRTTYGIAIERICELSLAWLDRAGLFKTDPCERRIELHWPSPIPESDLDRLQEAQAKLKLGVPQETILRELGY